MLGTRSASAVAAVRTIEVAAVPTVERGLCIERVGRTVAVTPSPEIESTSTGFAAEAFWRSYIESPAMARFLASASRTSRIKLVLPHPDGPVTTVNAL